jgi:CubicO group peptidase (beta-lactamase class C family)
MDACGGILHRELACVGGVIVACITAGFVLCIARRAKYDMGSGWNHECHDMHDLMKTFGRICCAVVLLWAASRPAAAQPGRFDDADRVAKLAAAFPEVDRLMKEFVTRSHVPGAAWGLIVDGTLVHTGATGFRELASKAPVDADTVFRIASMTKSFTAMAILKLRDEGKLSLDDPVERYVPELKALEYPTTDSPRITIRHLLSHSEGFPEDNPWGDQQLAKTEEAFSAMMRGGIPFSNAPGVAYEYSNYGFAILGRVVTRVSGVPYREYVAAHILRPLGMSSTTLEPGAVPPGRLAHGYRWEDETWKEEPQLKDGAFGAMGGLLTSIRDLSRYVGAHLSAWPPRDGAETAPIRRASLREMQQTARRDFATVRRDPVTSDIQLTSGGYGFGLSVIQTCSFRHVVAHGGGLPGFGSVMRWLPEHGVGIIAFGNRTYTGWAGVAMQALEALARTGALQPRVAQPSPALVEMRDAVTRLVDRWDDRLAERIAADNLFLDESKERRRRALEALRAKVGACKPDGGFDVENALRGQWTLACERGTVRAAITLAPTMPPLVQFLSVREVQPQEPSPPQTCPQR